MSDDQLDLALAYQFKVVFSADNGAVDSSFQELSGIETTMPKKTFQEGGENRFEHSLVMPKQHGNLILKRGLTKLDAPLIDWCKSVLEGDMSLPIQTMPLQVFALDRSGKPRAIWSFENSFPCSWKLGAFNAIKNEVAIETIELSYNSVIRMR